MNKQIIIDVQECEFWQEGHCECYASSNYPHCLDFTNCYYKQLKRKEKECENNKIAHQMELDIFNQECFNLQEELKETLEQLDQLKVENEKLKQYKGSKQASYETMQREWNEAKNEVKKLKAENWELKRELMQYEKDVKDLNHFAMKLKQTLAEIKEIADVNKNYKFKIVEQILNKIKEVDCE